MKLVIVRSCASIFFALLGAFLGSGFSVIDSDPAETERVEALKAECMRTGDMQKYPTRCGTMEMRQMDEALKDWPKENGPRTLAYACIGLIVPWIFAAVFGTKKDLA